MSRFLSTVVNRAATFTPSGVDVAARTVSGIVTTQKVDSHRSIILTDGLDWSRFLKNPVFVAQHDTSCLPIGTCINLVPGDGQVECTFRLSESDEGEAYLQAYAAGELRGFSICGRIMDYVTRWDGEEAIKSLPEFAQKAFLDGTCVYVIKKMQIHEISAATVPSNDETLVFRSAREANLECELEILRHQMDSMTRAKCKPKMDEEEEPLDPCEEPEEECSASKLRRISAVVRASLSLLKYR